MIAQLDSTYINIRPSKVWSRLVSYGLFEGRPITTRGQWINPLVFSLYKVWETLPQGKEVKKPIFIIGTGRSGTTLLGMVLSMHKDISFLNEPKALWHEIFDKEDLIGSYSRGEAFYYLNEMQVNKEMKKNAHKLFGAYLSISGGRRVLDKYPELIFRIPFVKEIFTDAKFLFITRSGRDTLQSIDQWSDRLGEEVEDESHNWWGVNDRKWEFLCKQVVSKSKMLSKHQEKISSFEDHKDRATVEWIVTMEQGLAMMKEFPDSILNFRYEDFLLKPDAILKKISNFASLKGDNKMVRYANEVIGKPADKKDISIHPLLEESFVYLMEKFGYEK